MKKYRYIKLEVVVFLLLCHILSSCVDIGRTLESENGYSDVSEAILIPDTLIPVKEFYRDGEKIPLSDPYTVSLHFGIPTYLNVDDIQTYNSNLPRLKYHFSIPCPVLPPVKLNSFSFTDKKGDTIPCILYYKTRDTTNKVVTDIIINGSYLVTDGIVINIIDSFPAIFTNDIKKEMSGGFTVFAECSQSYASIKTVYINYDIEVGDKRFVKQCKYTKKWYFDMRPKLW